MERTNEEYKEAVQNALDSVYVLLNTWGNVVDKTDMNQVIARLRRQEDRYEAL